VGQKWIALELGMGNRANVSRAIQRIEKSDELEVVQRKKQMKK